MGRWPIFESILVDISLNLFMQSVERVIVDLVQFSLCIDTSKQREG